MKITYLVMWVAVFFLAPTTGKAETYYKYVDENGTVVITQNWDDVPEDQRDKTEEVHFPEQSGAEAEDSTSAEAETLGKAPVLALQEIVNEENIKRVGGEALRQGKDLVSSFLEDQKTVLIIYGIAGIVGFFLFSKRLKRFAGGLVAKIVMKLAMMIVIFSGVYLLYLSWLNKTVLNFNPSDDFSNQNLADQISTPGEILEQTQEVVDQFNKNTTQREALLNKMDGN